MRSKRQGGGNGAFRRKNASAAGGACIGDSIGDYPVTIEVPVAWGEMDAFQHVNNIVYFRYFESARIAYFDKIGIWEFMEADGVGPILASTRCSFKIPLAFPDTVTVGTGFPAGTGPLHDAVRRIQREARKTCGPRRGPHRLLQLPRKSQGLRPSASDPPYRRTRRIENGMMRPGDGRSPAGRRTGKRFAPRGSIRTGTHIDSTSKHQSKEARPISL